MTRRLTWQKISAGRYVSGRYEIRRSLSRWWVLYRDGLPLDFRWLLSETQGIAERWAVGDVTERRLIA